MSIVRLLNLFFALYGQAAGIRASSQEWEYMNAGHNLGVYNETEAKLYAHYSRASFCERCALARWSCGESCDAAPILHGSVQHLGPGKSSQVRGYVALLPDAAGKKHCVVTFRGTVNYKNVETDAKVSLVPWPLNSRTGGSSVCPDCRVHGGFATAYEELEFELFEAFQQLSCHRASMAGHSLGGAVAALAAFRLRTELKIPVSPVYLLGMPKVGNDAFVDHFVTTALEMGTLPAAWRVINEKDPIPRLPFSQMGYRHFPQEVYYTRNAEPKVCNALEGEDKHCAAAVSVVSCWNGMGFHSDYLGLNHEHHKLDKSCTLQNEESNCGARNVCRCSLLESPIGLFSRSLAVQMAYDANGELTTAHTKTWSTLGTTRHSCEGELTQHLGWFDQHEGLECTLETASFIIGSSGEKSALGLWMQHGHNGQLSRRGSLFVHADKPDLTIEFDLLSQQWLMTTSKPGFLGIPTSTTLYKNSAKSPADHGQFHINGLPLFGWVSVYGAPYPPFLTPIVSAQAGAESDASHIVPPNEVRLSDVVPETAFLVASDHVNVVRGIRIGS